MGGFVAFEVGYNRHASLMSDSSGGGAAFDYHIIDEQDPAIANQFRGRTIGRLIYYAFELVKNVSAGGAFIDDYDGVDR